MKILIEKIDKSTVLTAVVFYLCLDVKQVKDLFET